MGAEQVEQRSSQPVADSEAGPSQPEAGGSYDIVVRRATADPALSNSSRQQDPLVLVVREILDLPRQILPEETYVHLKNAAREATLAVFSLVNSLSGSTRSSDVAGEKPPRRIDVE